jgi:hypothetical protein
MLTLWQRVWNDPVWSKVIASAILGGGALAFALIPKNFSIWPLLVVLGGLGLLLWSVLHVTPAPKAEREAAPQPPTPAPPAPPIVERTIESISPEHLVSYYTTRTTFQADKVVAPFLGKWIKTEGDLRDVLGSVDEEELMAAFYCQGSGGEQPILCAAWFMVDRWGDRIGVLRPHQRIVVVGQIHSVDRSSITLRKCELVA